MLVLILVCCLIDVIYGLATGQPALYGPGLLVGGACVLYLVIVAGIFTAAANHAERE